MNLRSTESRSRLFAALILVLTVVYALGSWRIAREQQFANTTTFGKRSEGISVFFDLIRSLGGNPTVQTSPFFEKLPPTTQLAILAPNSPITPREAKLFADAVKSGAKLLLSLQDKNDFLALLELHMALDWKVRIDEAKDFKNGQSVTFSIKEGPLAAPQETYRTYGRFYFEESNGAPRYYLYKKWGKGEIHYFIGLTPFSNVLISQNDNPKLAVRLAKELRWLTFDEYHHYFSDRTFWDLLKTPAFGVTIAGIIITLFLFFLFGHTALHEKHLIPPPRNHAASFHEFGEKFLRTTVGQKGQFENNLRQHYRLLSRLYPDEKGLIEREQQRQLPARENRTLNQRDYLKAIAELVRFHANILRKKGRLLS